MSGGGGEDSPARASFADWKRLDLDPGSDERAARAAYARALKLTKPEVDPEGFQALRAAYERVLEEIRNPSATGPRGEGATDTAAPPRELVDATAVGEVVHAIAARRRRGDTAGALAALDASLDGGLRLAWRHAVEDAILDDVADDASARPDLLQGLASRFDWREATGRHAAEERMGPLRERVESADYVTGLRARVAAARAGGDAPGDAMLLKIVGPYEVGQFDRAPTAEERAVAEEILGAFFQHLADVDGLIDARTLAALRSSLGAAPLMRAPPEPGAEAEASPTETKSGGAASTAVQKPGIWGRITKARPNWIWIGLVLVFLKLGASGNHTSYDAAPSPSEPQSSQADMPTIPSSLDVVPQTDGTSVVRLEPLTHDLSNVQALLVERQPGSRTSEIEPSTLEFKPSFTLPEGTSSFTLRYRFRDGSTSVAEMFDVTQVAKPAPKSPGFKPPDVPEFKPR